MKAARRIGRVGGLAVALGTGAWLCSLPWSAPADADTSGTATAALGGLDPASLVGLTGSDPSGLNIDVSYNGMDLFHVGDATAHSGINDFAIAYGDGATADAGTYTNPDGVLTTGTGDYAFANGDHSTAIATGADYSNATATDGGTAYSGIAMEPGGAGVSVSPFEFDSASASGAGSVADAEGGSFDSATASGGGTADAGFLQSTFPGIGLFNGGSGDSATAAGTGSLAEAGLGNNNIAEVFGNHSNAFAGGVEGPVFGVTGNDDFAGVFGDGLTANSTSGTTDGIFNIATPFGEFAVPEAASAALPADDFGLSSLLADLSSLGL
jgi:hypothetical protein